MATVLGRQPAQLLRVDDDDSRDYWDAVCAAMPPMTAEQIHTVGVVLRRIDNRPRAG